MKKSVLLFLSICGLGGTLAMPRRVLAQTGAAPNQAATHHHYKLIDLGTFGGPNTGVNIEPFQNVINNAGTDSLL